MLQITRSHALVVIAILATHAPRQAAAQSLYDLESKVTRFRSDAQSIYRFDEEARQKIWEAYCGQLDPGYGEGNTRFAAEVGQNFQQRQRDSVHRLLSEIGPLAEGIDRFQRSDSKDRDKAGALLDVVRREERTLQGLEAGVVLKGSNHPFTQFAVEYGKRQHSDLCGREGEQPKVCDKNWPGISGRPDLVFVNDSALWIYEFKPDNSAARDMGERQVREYVGGVVAYLQQFFPKGREGGVVGSPDGDRGAIVEKLQRTPRAWSGDGSTIQVQTKVVTYPMCEKRF